MINLASLIGLKVQPLNDDDAAESALLRSLDRWGDRPYQGQWHDAEDLPVTEIYHFEPKARRKVRFAAIHRGCSSQ